MKIIFFSLPKYYKFFKNDQNIKQISGTFPHFLTYQTIEIYPKKKKYRKALKYHESHTNFHPKPKITKAIQEKVEPPSKPTFVAAPLLTERRRYCVFSDRQKETRSSDSRLLRNRRRLHLALEEALAHYLPRQNLHRRLCVTES